MIYHNIQEILGKQKNVIESIEEDFKKVIEIIRQRIEVEKAKGNSSIEAYINRADKS